MSGNVFCVYLTYSTVYSPFNFSAFGLYRLFDYRYNLLEERNEIKEKSFIHLSVDGLMECSM